ncbi:MAG: glycoside hydrolase family 125 protein [Bacillota bacterium]|nr:glycoside hydrolase family 125 protein [Bacillota bacterium]MDW7685250.1 glycoside hydrolase family 125 protein [Bacillota bacterium]
MPRDILTVPQETAVYKTILAHGNEYMSFPEIHPKSGGVQNITVLHMGSLGLLEFAGDEEYPLIQPYIKVDGSPVRLRMAWTYKDDWLPAFTARAAGLVVRGRIFAPPGHRGAVYLLRIKNNGSKTVLTEAGFALNAAGLAHHIFRGRDVAGGLHCRSDRWTKTLLVEAGGGLPLATLALGLDLDEPWWLRPAEAGATRADAAKVAALAPGDELVLPLYLTVNIEGSGAGTTVVDLRRHGWEALLLQTEGWLQKRRQTLTEFQAVANRNLFFNYFFALGRTLDTDDWVPVTSRSPRYYVSAAFWSRDTLLWSFPGLLLVEPAAARQVLLAVFDRHLERAGEHAHYINGVLLYPGFELDQLASYILALKSYIEATGDQSVLAEAALMRGIPAIADKLLAVRDEETGLLSTFLDPSDDPVMYPYLVYDNALAQRAIDFLARLQETGWQFSADMETLAADLKDDIYRHGVVPGPFGPMFAWAVDGRGGFQLYDNPPGSLQLLPHYGFCAKDDPAWENTIRWIYSEHNLYYHGGGRIRGAASRHAANPWPLAAASDLLGQDVTGANLFTRAVLDSGFCCETVDPQTGRASTGHAFASAAGFIGYALWRAFGTESKSGEEG